MSPVVTAFFTGAGLLVAITIDEKLLVPITTTVAICSATTGLVWWMGRRFQKWDDNQEFMKTQIMEVRDKIDKLPCETGKVVCFPTKRTPNH